jgi:16S rRNA (cytosine967-C5)-methyltransferase
VPRADLVLVDAPCSGLGTLRRNPDLKLRHGPEDVERFQRLQLEILRRWAPRVRPGGRLAYATCSILRAENEEVAEVFAAEHPAFEPCPSAWAAEHLPAQCRSGCAVRLDPVLTGTDGFFVTIWRRR